MLVNHNGAGCLPRALEALAANTTETDVECLVVDSGSADGSWQDVNRVWEKARASAFADESVASTRAQAVQDGRRARRREQG